MTPPLQVGQSIFAQLLELPTEHERKVYIREACGGDEGLTRSLEALLEAHDSVENFIEPPYADDDHEEIADSFEGPGTVIGRYRILEQIGEGGFGMVYLAEQQEPVQREVALKIIKVGMDTRQVVGRFETERQALAMMNHPNIARVFDGGATQSGRPYFVMELVQGVPLIQFCREQSLSLRARLELFISVCEAVQHAHQKAVIHRDLKPGNILIALDDADRPVPKVIDFGVAKAVEQPLTDKNASTNIAQLIGTPAYMSPEQADRTERDIDTRSDVYSLGVILYELLTGSTPFEDERLRNSGFVEMQRIINSEEPERPSTRLNRLAEKKTASEYPSSPETIGSMDPLVAHSSPLPIDLDWIVLKAIEKDRDQRYETPKELAADIRRHLEQKPILARSIGSAERLMRWTRRNPTVATLMVTLMIAIMAGLGGTLWQLDQARQNAASNLRQIARLNVLNGVNLMQEGDTFRSLLWFTKALSLNAVPSEQAAVDRQRIASIVNQGPRLAAVITHDGQPIGDATFHPIEDRLATIGRDRRLRVWDISSGEMVFMTEPFDEPPSGVWYSPDGKKILVTSSEYHHAFLLSASDGEPLTEPIPHFTSGANNQPLPPRFDATGDRLLTHSSPGTLRVWNTGNASPLGSEVSIPAPIVWTDFSTDGTKILAFTKNGEMTAWDWHTGAEEKVPADLDLPALIKGPVLSPDGSRSVSVSNDGRVRVRDAETNEPLTPPIDHNFSIGFPEFSASGRYFFTIHPSHAVFVWEMLQDNEPPVLLRPQTSGMMVESGRGGAVFLSRDPNNPIRVRALSEATEISLHPSSLKANPVQAWFDKTGRFVVLESGGKHAQIWDTATGLPVTPTFQSRYATNEADYRTVKLPRLFPLEDTSDFQLQSSVELLSGSRLDGTGGWRPLKLGEIVLRWNHLVQTHAIP